VARHGHDGSSSEEGGNGSPMAKRDGFFILRGRRDLGSSPGGGDFTARSGGIGRAQQRDRELDLRWCRDLAPMDGWSRDRLKQLR
jgi:hypothetical protein